MTIYTNCLRLIPFTLEYVRTTIDKTEKLPELIEVTISNEWPNPDYKGILPFIEEQLYNDPSVARLNRLIVNNEDNTLIGEIGCKVKPNKEGKVEIGYSIVSDYQNRGIATEAVQAFTDWLLALPEVKKVMAECVEENKSSARVLEKTGFKQIGQENGLLFWEIGR